MLPSLGPEYRTTTGMYKWIVLGVAIGSVLLYLMFQEAMRETDEMYERNGVPLLTNSVSHGHR
jgi:hypothetical protein